LPEADPTPVLVAVVVTCNRLEQLRQTVNRLLETPKTVLARILVVDNASEDGTSEWLASLNEPRLTIVQNKTNLGGAGGFETGLRLAVRDYDPDWLLVMDDDARPEPGALAAFLAAPRLQAEAWVSAVFYPDGRVCEMNKPLLNPFWHPTRLLRSLFVGRKGFHLSPEQISNGPARAVDVGSFVGLFLSRRAIKLAGYPKSGMFLYGDDTLYCLDLRKAGGQIRFDPTLRFTHDCSTFQRKGGRFEPLWKVYYLHRNQLIVYRRAAGALLIWPTAALFWLKWRLQARHYGTDRAAYLRLLNKAMRDGLRGKTSMRFAEVLALAV